MQYWYTQKMNVTFLKSEGVLGQFYKNVRASVHIFWLNCYVFNYIFYRLNSSSNRSKHLWFKYTIFCILHQFYKSMNIFVFPHTVVQPFPEFYILHLTAEPHILTHHRISISLCPFFLSSCHLWTQNNDNISYWYISYLLLPSEI